MLQLGEQVPHVLRVPTTPAARVLVRRLWPGARRFVDHREHTALPLIPQAGRVHSDREAAYELGGTLAALLMH